MPNDDIEDVVRRLMAEGDLVGLFPVFDRRMDKSTTKAAREYIERAIEGASPETLGTLYKIRGMTRRDLIVRSMRARLDDPTTRESMAQLLRRLVTEGEPGEAELRATLAAAGALSLDGLREAALSRERRTSLVRSSLRALVRLGDGAWLEEQMGDDTLDPSAWSALISASVSDPDMTKRLVRFAREAESPEALAAVCEHFDVGPELVEKAVASGSAEARRHAMKHTHRLRDPREALRAGLTDPETPVRRAALACLVERPDPELREYVAILVDDPDAYDERYNTEPVSVLARKLLKIFE